MASGVECAGLVLAVLPLIVEAAKAYTEGVEDIKGVVKKRDQDDILQEFYEDFLIEITFVNRNIERLLEALPHIHESEKSKLKKEFRIQQWTPEKEIALALKELFESQYGTFEITIAKLMRLIGRVVSDESLNISSEAADEEKMFTKLRCFYETREQDKTLGTLRKRLKFRKDSQKRQQHLKTLQHYSQNLERLIDLQVRSQPSPETRAQPDANCLKPIDQILALGKMLFIGLSTCWHCTCHKDRCARFCLETIRNCINKASIVESEFDVLIDTAGDLNTRKWCEAVFRVRKKSPDYKQSRAVLSKICEAVEIIPRDRFSLQALVEESDGSPQAWQLRPQPRRLHIDHQHSPVTLHDLLSVPGEMKLNLRSKRQLALTIALSSLGLHEDTWLRGGWSKKTISFFKAADGTLDNERPFLTTDFTKVDEVQGNTMSLFHANERLFALGVLLIELHVGEPLEVFRTEDDLTNGEPNMFTDYTVATRVAERLQFECSGNYNDAIQACLNPQWLPGDQELTLDNPVVRTGLYNDVVHPLREELRYLFRDKV